MVIHRHAVRLRRITYDDLEPAAPEPAAPGPAGRLAERGYRVSAEEFMRAAREGDVNTLALFREAGLDVNIRCPGETTALMWTAGEGHREAVDWLLANGASLHVADPDFWTPLLWAERGGHEDIAERFRAAGLTEQRLFP